MRGLCLDRFVIYLDTGRDCKYILQDRNFIASYNMFSFIMKLYEFVENAKDHFICYLLKNLKLLGLLH